MSLVTSLTGLHIEGNLIALDMTSELTSGSLKGQAAENFDLKVSDKLADEIAAVWGEAKKYWIAFQQVRSKLDPAATGTSETRNYWAIPLLRSLGYTPDYKAEAEVIDGQTYAISHRAGGGDNRPPVHIIGCNIKLGDKPPSGVPRLSAHALLQEYLNRTEHLWGVVTNGLLWRLLRDSSLMTRLTYVEFDLEQILESENFAEFGIFYRLFHRSRLPQGIDDADECWLEFYHQETLQQGGRVRDHLRDGVEKALVQLGNGFLQHPRNQTFREKFASGELTERDFYRQLLLLIYRLLFLMVAESRNLLLANDDLEKARIYLEYYSIERLRTLAERLSLSRTGFQDLWQGLRVTFRLFDENWRGELLALSPLNGDLFGSQTLQSLDECALDNHDLMAALRHLSLYTPKDKAQLRRVNYAALDVEELGSVYESLLDFHPQVSQRQGIYEFQLVVGSDRKTTGSYYTPPELVGQLIKSVLEPVIEERLNGAKNSLTPQPPLPRGEEEQENNQNPSPLGRGAGVRDIIAAANQLAEEKHFFHWHLEFPDVFPHPLSLASLSQEGRGTEGEGGFDCILGNPPWERIKLQEKEFFASRDADIAKAANKSEREKLIKALPTLKPELAREFEAAKHDAEAQSKFIRESNRFPLTAVGDVNTYAVFSETIYKLISNSSGYAGFIIPSAILTSDTTKDFFGFISSNGFLSTVLDFAEIRDFFTGAESPDPFCLFVIKTNQASSALKQPATFIFKILKISEINNQIRKVALLPSDFLLLNPNTSTCPIFRTNVDANLTKKIYKNSEIIERKSTNENPWSISFKTGLFHMTNDLSQFFDYSLDNHDLLTPLYEAKMIHIFDHRFGSYETRGEERGFATLPETSILSYQNLDYKIQPFYWVLKSELDNRVNVNWHKNWFIVFRGVTKSLNERTAICSIIPKVGIANSLSTIYFEQFSPLQICCFISNFNSVIFDYVARQKFSGVNFNVFIVKQLPVLPPDRYTQTDIEFIAPRVLELVYTAWDIKPFADDLWNPLTPQPPRPLGEEEQDSEPLSLGKRGRGEGNTQLGLEITINTNQLELTPPPDNIESTQRLRELILQQWQANQQASLTPQPPLPRGEEELEDSQNPSPSGRGAGVRATEEGIPLPPFIWHETRRAQIRAELDAYYAKLYGLTRDELRYILDPADIYGADFPSETFRVLKNNEIKKYGEYRTQRLVLEAWDRLEGQEQVNAPPDDWSDFIGSIEAESDLAGNHKAYLRSELEKN